MWSPPPSRSLGSTELPCDNLNYIKAGTIINGNQSCREKCINRWEKWESVDPYNAGI